MTLLAALLPPLALAAALLLLGAALWSAAGRVPGAGRLGAAAPPLARSPEGWALAFVAGLVSLHLLLMALQAAGVPWRRLSLAVGVAVAVALLGLVAAGRIRRGDPRPAPGRAAAPAGAAPASTPWRWGGWVAGLSLAGFAAAVPARWVTLPDFVYHWGLKGKRYHLAGGVDFAFLSDPLRLTEHPDYPNLLPSLFAATAHLRGFFDEVSMLAWSVLFTAALLVLGRAALARGAPRRRLEGHWLEAGTAVFSLVTVMFVAGYQLAGGADLLVALGVVMALPALTAADRPGDDLRVGLAAALVAGAKIEGVPLAALLVAARWWVGGRGRGGGNLASRAARLPLPPLAVVVPWLWASARHGLFRQANTGAPDPERLPVVLGALGEALATPEWHGFAWLLLLLPLTLLVRDTRVAGTLLAAQASFYLFVYLSAQAEPRFYVLSSFPRLLFHLLPALLLLLWMLLAARPAGRQQHPKVAPAAAVLLACGLLPAVLAGCSGEAADPGVVRYDDLVTDRSGLAEGADDPRAQDGCADAAPYSRPLGGGREVVLEVDLGREPTLVLSFCRPGTAEGALLVRAERRQPGEAPAVGQRIPVTGEPRWERRTVDLAPLLAGGGAGSADGSGAEAGGDGGASGGPPPSVPVRLTLRSTLPAGEVIRLEEAYVRHRAASAAGWPRSGVHVEGDSRTPWQTVEVEPGIGGSPSAPAPAPADSTTDRRSEARPPSVLLISLDTLRADVLDAVTAEGEPLTPNLHRLAAEGEVFDPHYAGASWTKPSHATLLTGYPFTVHRVDGAAALPPFVPTLAGRLGAAGYATGGLVHDCVWLNPKFGFHRGFDDYRSVKWETGQLRRGAFNWIADHARSEPQRPFFFFLHSFEPHSDFLRLPYEALGTDAETVRRRFGVPGYGCRQRHCASGMLDALDKGKLEPLPGEAEIIRHLYDAGVAETDAELGRLFDDLRDLGVWDELMVVVTSDHGELLLEHGRTMHGTAFEEVLRVPLVVKWPRSMVGDGTVGDGEGGRRTTRATSSVDVAATVAALAGAPGPDLPGVDLRRPRQGRAVFVGSAAWAVVVEDGWKLLLGETGNPLIHLAEDPGETRVVTDRHPRVVERLRGRQRELAAWSETTRERLMERYGEGRSGVSGPEAELSAEEKERLRALGYLR